MLEGQSTMCSACVRVLDVLCAQGGDESPARSQDLGWGHSRLAPQSRAESTGAVGTTAEGKKHLASFLGFRVLC